MSHEELPQQFDRDGWPRMRAKFEKAISQKTRDEWAMIFEGSDSCVFPVLSFKEAQQNKHNQLREIFAPSGDIDGALEPMPAPKLLRTPGLLPRKSPEPGAHSEEILTDFGFHKSDVAKLIKNMVVGSSKL